MSTTKHLIDAIADGDAMGIESSFNAAMAEKICVQLDVMRQNVAQNMFAIQEESFEELEEDFVIEWISEEEYVNLSDEEKQDYISEEQLDELVGKGSLKDIEKAHADASSGRTSDRKSFHRTQAARARHIMSKQDSREKYGKDSQHYHQYGSTSKIVKDKYAKLSPGAKKQVTKTLGKEYSGKDKAPSIQPKGKTTISNPKTKAQDRDDDVRRKANSR
jgi:hypothetical protein